MVGSTATQPTAQSSKANRPRCLSAQLYPLAIPAQHMHTPGGAGRGGIHGAQAGGAAHTRAQRRHQARGRLLCVHQQGQGPSGAGRTRREGHKHFNAAACHRQHQHRGRWVAQRIAAGQVVPNGGGQVASICRTRRSTAQRQHHRAVGSWAGQDQVDKRAAAMQEAGSGREQRTQSVGWSTGKQVGRQVGRQEGRQVGRKAVGGAA